MTNASRINSRLDTTDDGDENFSAESTSSSSMETEG